jgi:hypothetical protein
MQVQYLVMTSMVAFSSLLSETHCATHLDTSKYPVWMGACGRDKG